MGCVIAGAEGRRHARDAAFAPSLGGLRAILMLPVRPGSVFAGAGACMALVVIATLIGIAIHEGALAGVEQPIAPFFDSYLDAAPDSARGRITLGNLLSMQAGLEPTSGRNYGAWVTSREWVRYAIQRPLVEPILALRDELRAEGVTRIVLAGMGGSSLAPEVVAATAGVELVVLDSTDPEMVGNALADRLTAAQDAASAFVENALPATGEDVVDVLGRGGHQCPFGVLAVQPAVRVERTLERPGEHV